MFSKKILVWKSSQKHDFRSKKSQKKSIKQWYIFATDLPMLSRIIHYWTEHKLTVKSIFMVNLERQAVQVF